MSDKPENLHIYIENFVDNDPYMMRELCERINDKRVRLCLDTGHVCANSNVEVTDWISILGGFIGHANIHNNDGNRIIIGH
jgi:sugar phosphate isomerase/epimerase